MEEISETTPPLKWKIGLVENDSKYLDFIREELSTLESVESVKGWGSAEAFLEENPKGPIGLDLVFLDIQMDEMNGVELAARLNERDPDLRIVMLTMLLSDEVIFKSIQAGALGYLLKTELDSLKSVTEKIMSGGAFMTPTIALRVMRAFREPPKTQEAPKLTSREKDVLEKIGAGFSAKKAAEKLGISENTVLYHTKNIYKKLNVQNRVLMMQKASDLGLL